MVTVNLVDFVKNYENGVYGPSIQDQCNAGWFDWFCSDKSLAKRLEKMFPYVKAAAEGTVIKNPETKYVFFKNNCPVIGPKYDSFSICDLETGDPEFWVTLKSGHSGEAEIVDVSKNMANVLPVGHRTSRDVRKFFLGVL